MRASRIVRPSALVPPVFLALLFTAVRAPAQEAPGPADPADVASLDAIVSAFYEVVSGPPGAPRQWSRDATLYWPGAVFTIPGDGSGFRNVSPSEFARESDRFLVDSGFVEREIHRETHRLGPIAQVWSTYEWRTAEGATGRGINGLHLLHDGDRWWITHATWTNEAEGVPIPEDYLPDE